MSSVVPEGWQISSVEDLLTPDCLFSDGDWVESKDQDPAGTNRLLQLADIGDGRFVNKSNRFMNDEQFTRLNCTQLQEGDILIARMPEPIGRACILPRLDNRLATVVDIAILRPSAVDSYWLMSVINSAGFRTKIEELSSGTTRTRIGRTALSKIKLLSPPLPEQKKIASILTSVDEVIENTQKQIDKLQDLKKATMNELLTKGIGHTEFKDSELGRIPKSWEVVTLSEIILSLEGGVSVNGLQRPANSAEVGVLKVSCVKQGRFIPSENKVIEDYDRSRAKLNPCENTILISRANTPELVGESGYVERTRNDLFLPDKIWALRLNDSKNVDMRWLSSVLANGETRRSISDAATGTSSSMRNISKANLLKIQISLPPVLEQIKISRILSSLDAKLKLSAGRLNKVKTLKKSLMQDLLTGKVRVTVN